MFTGIITHLGEIKQKTKSRLVIGADKELIGKLSDGMSVAINGICLTVVQFDQQSFTIDYMPETEAKTSLSSLKPNTVVNLELPATPASFLAGHVVQGHVDGVGCVSAIEENGISWIVHIDVPKSLEKYMVNKGSISINGISLTIIDIANQTCTIGIIPHTWEKTMLHTIEIGDSVNIEVDVLAKYVEKLLRK